MPPLVPWSYTDLPDSDFTPEDIASWNRPEEIRWHCAVVGRMVHVYRTGVKMPRPPQSDKRTIGPWSGQSRMRMLKLLNQIDYPRLGRSVFLTLTYPDSCLVKEYAARTAQRTNFLRYVETSIGKNASCIWRIEWEERQSGHYTGRLAPHYHMMMLNVKWLGKEKVREWWRRTIKAPDGPLITDVRRIYNEDGVARYLSKYIAKYVALDLCTYLRSPFEFGQHWGCTRKHLIPMCRTRVDRILTEQEIKRFKRFGHSRWKTYGERGEGGFTVFGATLADNVAKMLGGS